MENKQKYGLDVMGVIRVFRKDKEVTSKNKKVYQINDVWFNVSEKDDDGTWFNKSMNMIFKRGLPIPENNTVIEVSAFPVLTGNGDYRKIALLVQDWKEVEKS